MNTAYTALVLTPKASFNIRLFSSRPLGTLSPRLRNNAVAALAVAKHCKHRTQISRQRENIPFNDSKSARVPGQLDTTSPVMTLYKGTSSISGRTTTLFSLRTIEFLFLTNVSTT